MSLISLPIVASAARAAKVRVSGSVSGNLSFSAGGAPRAPHAKAAPFTYQSNGYTMNSNGYLANAVKSRVTHTRAHAIRYKTKISHYIITCFDTPPSI